MSDLISRAEAVDVLSLGKEILSRVLDDIDVVSTDREKYSWGLELIESIIKDIEDLPSAQPELRTAYWTKDIVGSVICSKCGGIRKDNRISHMNFCNCCGADMRGTKR